MRCRCGYSSTGPIDDINHGVDGILGLMPALFSIPHQLAMKGAIRKVFGLCLKRYSHRPPQQVVGYLFLGDEVVSVREQMTWIQMVDGASAFGYQSWMTWILLELICTFQTKLPSSLSLSTHLFWAFPTSQLCSCSPEQYPNGYLCTPVWKPAKCKDSLRHWHNSDLSGAWCLSWAYTIRKESYTWLVSVILLQVSIPTYRNMYCVLSLFNFSGSLIF